MAPIDKLGVVLGAVFAVVFLGDKLSGPSWLGAAFIAGGTIPVAYKG